MKLKKYFLKSATSTNDVAIKKIKQGLKSGIIVANKQTRGRGRYGNKWIYMKNNLFMSVFFNLSSSMNLRKLTITSCKIVKKSLFKILNIKITIKKPNDLLINNKKVCGILQETLFYERNKFAIIGIGVNIHTSPNIYNYPTTYLNFFTKKKINKTKVFEEIKKNFENFLTK
tara:strand:- start:197 stop:712 length:516 start_codon:yes stop_codon:yes gene_type:complete